MAGRINAYLALERAMVDLDDAGDFEVADQLRDRMDPVWSLLSMHERAALDARYGSASIFAGSVAQQVLLRRDLSIRANVRAHFLQRAA